MNIEEIAANLTVEETLTRAFRRNEQKNNWLIELVHEAQDQLAGSVRGSVVVKKKGEIEDEQFVFLNKACITCENLAFTISAIYEEYSAKLKKELNALQNKASA